MCSSADCALFSTQSVDTVRHANVGCICRPPGAAVSIQSVLGPGVHVHVPVWAEDSSASQAVFRRGFFPAHRPMLSSYDSSSAIDAVSMSPGSPSNDIAISTYQGYALGRIRSQSPVPSHMADCPDGHDGSMPQPDLREVAIAHAGARILPPDDVFMNAAPAIDAEASVPAAAVAPPPLPGTPAPEDVSQVGGMDENVSASAGSSPETRQEHAAMERQSPQTETCVRQGVMPGMTSFGCVSSAHFAANACAEGSPSRVAHASHPSHSVGGAVASSSRQAGLHDARSPAKSCQVSGLCNGTDAQCDYCSPHLEAGDALFSPSPAAHGSPVIDDVDYEADMQPPGSSSDADSKLPYDFHDMPDIDSLCGRWSSEPAGTSHPVQTPTRLTGRAACNLSTSCLVQVPCSCILTIASRSCMQYRGHRHVKPGRHPAHLLASGCTSIQQRCG